MEYKPTITYSFSESGDESLFLTLSTHLRKILLNHPVKWKRSYGRIPHELTLDVKFLPLTSALLKRNDLVTRPYFHVFWSDCNDVDYYRSSVKSEIASWLSELFGNEIFDWLIVIVTGGGTSKSNKPKLTLPRTSLADKIKTDFCSKNPERLHILQDPMKDSAKSTESWSSLATKIAGLTVLCLENAVTKYEDRVRAERERRNEKSWNFCSYFILQEELAFMFEMLSLHDEALIQYDELDAMFTQYLLNAHAGDVAHWLSSFTRPISRWRSLSLWRRIDGEARQMLIDDTATLIDVRNYLFARHCHLLFVVGDLKKVTSLMHNFLHSTTLELDILEIELPPGAKDCWVFMSCMELTQSLERTSKQFRKSNINAHNTDSDMIMKMTNDELRLEIANLWNLARQKLFKLGNLCGLLPGDETSSKDLQTVVDLISGMGEEEERDGLVKPPSLILREALSSKENFRNQYLELSELAMGTFKHMDRYRSARTIGKELAEFYMRADQPEKAESFLLDSVRMYQNESWPLLTANASVQLANCYKRLCNVRRYVRLCCALMCDKHLSEEKRLYFCNELHSNSTDFGDNSLPILLAVFANVRSIQFIPAQTSFRYGSKQRVVLHVHSKAPKAIQFQSLQLSLRRNVVNNTNEDSLDKSTLSDTLFEEQDELDAVSYATFSSDEETGYETESFANDSKDKSSDSLGNSFRRHTPKNHVRRRRRFISTNSYDSIYTITQKTQLGPEGLVQLVTMDEPFNQQLKCVSNRLPPIIHIAYELEEKNDEISWAGITCRSARQLLRRQDSYQSLCSIHSSTTNIVMEAYNDNLEVKNVSIHPGDNTIVLGVDTSKDGQYTLRQLRFSVNRLHFVLPRILPVITYNVTKDKPTVVLDHESRLFCNIEQSITAILTFGDYHLCLTESDPVFMINLPNQIRICKIDSLIVQLEDGNKKEYDPNSKSEGTRYFITLPRTIPVHSKIFIKIICICSQPTTLHDLGYKFHRRTQSAPPSTVHKDFARTSQVNTTISDSDTEKVFSYRDHNEPSSKLPHSPLRRDNRSGESPVKKFLSFVREVADRVESKNSKTEENKISEPIIIVKDDFLEVTLDESTDISKNSDSTSFGDEVSRRLSISSSKEKSSSGSMDRINDNFSDDTISVNSIPSIKKSSSLSDKHSVSKSSIHVSSRHGNTFAVVEETGSDENNEVICNISFTLPWNDVSSISSSVVFTRLLEFSYKQHWLRKCCDYSTALVKIISVVIVNSSPCFFIMKNFCLKFINSGKVHVTRLTKNDKIVQPSQEVNLLWKVEFLSSTPTKCNAHFNVDIMKNNDFSVATTASYNFEIENTKTIYTISTHIDKEGSEILCGNMATLIITVRRLCRDPEHEHTRSGQQLLMYQVVDTRGRWAVCGKSTGVLSLPSSSNAVCTATLEIMPLIDGFLHHPSVILQRYLKRRSSEFDEQLSSTESPVLKPPRLMDFKHGEVLNLDEFKQVQVFATLKNIEKDVNGMENEDLLPYDTKL